jgi:tetratricopeptide (TPR) repeat protein
MDANNPIIRLCAEGMGEQALGNREAAEALFMRAWNEASDDYEACIAAHYLARCREDQAEASHWNEVALTRADRVDDERVRDFYPSLHLNMGHSYELRGDRASARRQYELAATRIDELPEDPYTVMIRKGIAAGLERVEETGWRGVE